jgi:hypothetical protein
MSTQHVIYGYDVQSFISTVIMMVRLKIADSSLIGIHGDHRTTDIFMVPDTDDRLPQQKKLFLAQ